MAASMAGSHACMTLAHLPSLSPPTQTCRRYTQRGLGLSYISHFTPTPTYTPTRTSLVLRLLCRRYTHTGNRGVAFALFYSIMNVAALTQVCRAASAAGGMGAVREQTGQGGVCV